MSDILPQCVAANAMFNDVRRANTEAFIGSNAPQHVVFSDVVFDALNAANAIDHATARDDSRSNGELFALHHNGCEESGMKIGIHANGFQSRPDATARNGPVRTRHQTKMQVRKNRRQNRRGSLARPARRYRTSR
jgi:hypothetical protein